MSVKSVWRIVLAVAMTATTVPLLATPASASHSWNGYHWSASSYPIDLRPINSFSDGFRSTSIPSRVNSDWNQSGKLANTQRYGSNGRDIRRNCPYPTGKSYRMCDYNWGANGWAGLAQIQVSGSHILRGRVKVNNYYGTSNSYRRHVLCQEVGHIFGLDHQANGNHSCMDDSSLGWDEPDPNAHDYDMLNRIYDHRHSSAPAVASVDENAMHSHSNRKVTQLPNGDLLIEFILPAPVQS